MMDNRKVKDSHQEGINRVKQRSGDMKPGQQGRMQQKSSEKANWRRSGGSMTPRQG